MSLPEDFLWRGCASNYTEPLTEEEEHMAASLVDMVVHSNPGFTIEFKDGTEDYDRTRHVFRFTRQPPEQIFRDGFQAVNVHNTSEERYYNLTHSANHGGEPLGEHNESFAFISTSANASWIPPIRRGTDIVYRYEIYAPGGIFVVQTLGATCRFPNQAEVAFVGGIAPQYIRSAQRYRTRETGLRYPRRLERTDNDLLNNTNFNPRPGTQLQILEPVSYFYQGSPRRRQPLNVINLDFIHPRREKRQVPTDDPDWYATLVGDTDRWISGAFRSSKSDEAYVFMNNEYVLINYAPETYVFMNNEYVLIEFSQGTKSDWVVNGPLPIYEGFPSLASTFFAEW